MKTLVLDTNALLRFLLNDIPLQNQEVKEKIKLAKSGKMKLIIHPIVIFEVVYTLTKTFEFPKDEVVENLKNVIGFKYLEVYDRETLQEALTLFKAKNLSFADCFFYKFSQNLDAELFTFDKNLKKLR